MGLCLCIPFLLTNELPELCVVRFWLEDVEQSQFKTKSFLENFFRFRIRFSDRVDHFEQAPFAGILQAENMKVIRALGGIKSCGMLL